MSYTVNVPQSGASLGSTRVPINTNFSVINTIFNQNHNPFSAATNPGKHKFLQMPSLESAGLGVPTTAAGEGGMYVKNDTRSPTQPALWYRGQSDGKEYQLTKPIQAQNATFGVDTASVQTNVNGGWTYLPGGLILQYGAVIIPAAPANPFQFNWPIQFPNGTPFSIQLTLQPNVVGTKTVNVRAGTVTNTLCRIDITNIAVNDVVYFYVIGI